MEQWKMEKLLQLSLTLELFKTGVINILISRQAFPLARFGIINITLILCYIYNISYKVAL